jgi:hypothetical protein
LPLFLLFLIVSFSNPVYSAVFQAGGLVVVLVEVSRKPYLASIVPVIVNAILNEHQIIVDIVAFVSKGDFPRSRLGEKQRGKILAGWVTRKLRTLAQFAIRDLDAAAMGESGSGSGTGDLADANRMSTGSIRSSGMPAGASSLRNVEHAPQILEQEEFDFQMNRMSHMPPPPAPRQASTAAQDDPGTPTGYAQGLSLGSRDQDTMNHDSGGRPQYYDNAGQYGGSHPDSEPPPVGPKPDSSGSEDQSGAPKIRMALPGVDGREGFQFWDTPQDDETDWTADAIMHMNLAGAK